MSRWLILRAHRAGRATEPRPAGRSSRASAEGRAGIDRADVRENSRIFNRGRQHVCIGAVLS